jgi:hypothetical protein
MRELILKWLGIAVDYRNDGVVRNTKWPSQIYDMSPNYRIGIITSMNGTKVLEVGTYSQQKGKHFAHDEWTYEFFTVEPDQKLSDAIALVLTMKGLEK